MKKMVLSALFLALGAPAAYAEDSVGIPACDDFIAKYQTCINDKVPEANRAQMAASVDQMITSWKQVAGTPEGKQALEQSCTQTTASMKASMSAYGCEF